MMAIHERLERSEDTMTADELNVLLVKLGACKEAVVWSKGKTLAEAWKQSKRADWMLWLCGKMADKPSWPSRQQIILAACACARSALKYVPKGEERPRIAVETAESWARGKATIEQVTEADAAAAAYTAADAAADAAAAAYTAADAAAAAYAATHQQALSKMSAIVRKILKFPALKK